MMTQQSNEQEIQLKENYKVFKDQLPSLIVQYGKGRFVLMKDKQFIAVFNDKEDALTAAKMHFSDDLFSIQEITDVDVNLGFYSVIPCH